jgi:hypothetical protein
MLLERNYFGKSPADIAIKRQNLKCIEIILEKMCELPDIHLSEQLSHYFPDLLEMGLKSFDDFLETCFFKSNEMMLTKKVPLEKFEETKMIGHNSSLLDERFREKLGITPKHKNVEQTSNYGALAGEEEEVKAEEDDDECETRVEIKAIEFDWVFTDKRGEKFMNALGATENIEIFTLEIIKNVILFQWNILQKQIIRYTLFPFLLALLTFAIQITWIFEKTLLEYKEESHGLYTIFFFIIGGFNLAMCLFFLVMEIYQVKFHKL